MEKNMSYTHEEQQLRKIYNCSSIVNHFLQDGQFLLAYFLASDLHPAAELDGLAKLAPSCLSHSAEWSIWE